MAIGTVPNFTLGKSKSRSTLGGLRDALMKPLPEELRLRHKRVHKIAELLLEHQTLSQQEIEERLEQGDPDFDKDLVWPG